MRRGQLTGDEQLVRSAARGFGTRAAALVAVGMLLLMGTVTAVVVRQQSAAADNLLRSTAATADDVGDPPPGAWLVLTRPEGTESSPGLPEDVASELPALRTSPATTVQLRDVTRDGRHFEVATLDRPPLTVQVVLDLTAQRAQRERLLRAMGVATVLALLFAAAVGVLLGRRAVRPVADALALQRTFVADASHELRTPLTLLSTRAQVLALGLAQSPVDPQVHRDADGVVNDIRRLGEVVEDLLIAADPRREEPTERVDLRAVAAAALDSARDHAGEAGVLLHGDLGDPDAFVTGSEAALRRALLALVDNAVDHTPAGGEVTVTVRHDSRQVRVLVRDTGAGIATQAGTDVLRRFHSGGHRAGRQHYGLGLALTHDVANRYGGQLRLLPSDTGATFELSLPAAG